MGLVVDLLPFVAAAYLLDAAAIVRSGQVLFVSGGRGRFTARGPGLRWPGLLPTAEALLVAKAAPLGSEEAARRALRLRCDVVALRCRWSRQARTTATLKALSAVFFLALFALVPASLIVELPIRPSPGLAASVCAVLWLAIVAESARLLHRRGLGRGAVAGRLWPLVVFPPAAAHAPAALVRDLFASDEPVAVAAVLLEPSSFRALARRWAAERTVAGVAGAVPSWLGPDEAFDLVLGALGLTEADLLAAPARQDPTASAYCPLCQAEYRRGFARCSDCDTALAPFPA